MVTRHEFLTSLHQLIQPQVYVETGVQTGASLALSRAPLSIGIDPHPIVTPGLLRDNHSVFTATSDEYFRDAIELEGHKIDLAFVDGMHLAEYALRDFIRIEEHSHPRTVVAFDDMLPRNQEEAARVMGAGDWTGDVWRLWGELGRLRPDLSLILVDTWPTGILLVTRLDAGSPRWCDDEQDIPYAQYDPTVPPWVLDRRHAWSPDLALEQLARWRANT